MKRVIAVLLVLLMLSGMALLSFAHSGGTDSQGGHNSSSGYHYHHGYPAHQHTHGVCPYDYDDKTGENSGSSGGSGGSSDSGTTNDDSGEQAPTTTTITDKPSFWEKTKKDWKENWVLYVVVILVYWWVPVVIVGALVDIGVFVPLSRLFARTQNQRKAFVEKVSKNWNAVVGWLKSINWGLFPIVFTVVWFAVLFIAIITLIIWSPGQ